MAADRRLIEALKALGDATRFHMIQEIAATGELSCGQLVERFPLSQPTISHHLKILFEAGLLAVRTEGKHHYASVNHALLGELGAALPLRLGPAAGRRRPAKTRRQPARRPR